MTNEEICRNLAQQSRQDFRIKYDGHNRRSIQSSQRRLRHRRWRRLSKQGLRMRMAFAVN